MKSFGLNVEFGHDKNARLLEDGSDVINQKKCDGILFYFLCLFCDNVSGFKFKVYSLYSKLGMFVLMRLISVGS